MSSMDPSGGTPGYNPEQAGHAPESTGGACSVCGRPLPPADLEAVAAEIDQTLSLETGKMVARTAWAGRPPDGLADALFSFMPGAKARRHLWERGQQLWAEQMTAAMSGPCADCQQGAGGYAPAATIMQPNSGPRYDTASPTPAAGSPYGGSDGSPYDSGTAMMDAEPSAPPPPAAAPYAYQSSPPAAQDEGQTAAFSPYQGISDAHARPTDDAATSEVPAFLRDAPKNAPTPSVPSNDPPDDYESHTVMMTSPFSLRPTAATARLIVVAGPVHGRQFAMNRAATTIGRSIGCHVTVDDAAVAYDHARVVRSDTGWHVEGVAGGGDLFVNDAAVNGTHPLRSGDVIGVGPARLRFETTS